MAITSEYIDLTPESLKTPEGAARVRKAQDEWDDVTHQLANAVKEIFNAGGYLNSDDIHQIKALIGARDRKQDEFLRAVAGR